MELSSPAFNHKGTLPVKYTCQGKNINPPLKIREIPEKTKTLVLFIDDPDAPGKTWNHWIVFNIKPNPEVTENSVPGIQGKNSWGNSSYGGPCPPSGTHRYFFRLFALDIELDLAEEASREEVEKAMKSHII